MTLGFIGLGSLGTPIAENIIASGHTLHVYNRTASKAAPLAAKGAIVAESVAALARQCNIVFTIVSDDAAIKEVSNELLQLLAPGSIHISMSTILPQTAADLAALHSARGQHYLASPVFGRPEAAVARKLNFVISGEENIRTQATPLLKDAGAAGVWDFGGTITAANTVKLCGNYLILAALDAMGESIALANKSGVDANKMWDMFGQTLFASPIYQNYSKIILAEKFRPAAFTARLGLKDMKLVGAQAVTAAQPMPLQQLLQSQLEQLIADGQGDIDWSAISTVASHRPTAGQPG
ncbi:MAG: NAD(P)-dependent oxidoreductase [Bacteroidetes bacterium]|nr:NAD(P)-dependent oxidoreductase [Bacteroidota bacterium]